MTNVQMLARLRSFVDESTNGFWDDTKDLYPALANGQREYCAIILAQYLARLNQNTNEPVPLTLLPIYNTATASLAGGLSSFTKPADFEFDIALKLLHNTTTYNLRKRDLSPSVFFKQANPYSSAALGYYSIDASNVNIERLTNTDTVTYYFAYLITLSDISSSQSPILPEFTHTAILQYAYAEVLLKSKQQQEANLAFNKFLQLVQYR